MTGAGQLSAEERAQLQARVRDRAPSMDLPALLALLWWLGWHPDEVRFASPPSSMSQPGLIAGVDFADHPRHVKVYLNLGLLGAQSPLPSYFFRRMDEIGFDNHHFVEFIGFFDHAALTDLLHAIYPETDARLFPDWETAKWREVQLLNLRSTSTLSWLFQSVFPDLRVTLEKATVLRELEAGGLRLGAAVLGGDAVLGRRVRIPVQSRQIVLATETERAASGLAWPAEIQERLQRIIMPILGPVGVDLDIHLEVRSHEAYARLHGQSYLGYDRVQGGEDSYRRIRIYSGNTATWRGPAGARPPVRAREGA